MSRPTRTRILLVLAFVLTLAAGVVVGAALARQAFAGDPPKPVLPADPTRGHPDQRNWIADQLNLNPEQRAKVDAIWKETNHDKIRELSEQRRSLFRQKDEAVAKLYTPEHRAERERLYREYRAREAELDRERDAAIQALYKPEQKAERERLEKEYEARIADAGRQRDALFQPMVERTRQVLTEEQRARFDGMLRGGDRHRGGPGSRPGTQPSTRPFGMPPFDRGGRGGPGGRGPGDRGSPGDGGGGRPPLPAPSVPQ